MPTARARRPYTDRDSGDRLPADHPLAPRLIAAGQAAADRMAAALEGLDGLAEVDRLVVLREGESVYIAAGDRAANEVRWCQRYAGPYWSPAAVRSVSDRPRSPRAAIAAARRWGEMSEWQEICLSSC